MNLFPFTKDHREVREGRKNREDTEKETTNKSITPPPKKENYTKDYIGARETT